VVPVFAFVGPVQVTMDTRMAFTTPLSTAAMSSSSKHPLVGNPAPALSLPNADGTTYELKPGGEGKPTAVFFYPKAGAYLLLAMLLRFIIRGYPLAQGPMAARGKSALSGMRSAVRHPMVQHPV
jgi:hypothetical protein